MDLRAPQRGKLRLMLIERIASDLCVPAWALLAVLGFRAWAVVFATASLWLAARSRRP